MKRIKKLAPLFVLALALCAMAANMLYWGSVKEGFHGDELYSYQFVSVPGYPSINASRPGQPYLNAWHDASYFEDYLTVSEDEAFELGSVISNILPDDHPPLFYMLLKLACSLLSRGQFSKWPGILLNLALFLLTQVALFALSKRLFRSSWWAALVCAVYGMSIGAVSAVMYTRMYVLLTLDCTIYLGVHVRLWEHYLHNPDGRLRQRIPAYAALLLSTVLGILTHYYFLVFAFFMCALLWGWLLVTRRDRLAVEYAVAAGSGVAAAVLLWPNLLYDLLKGHRGVEAFNNFSSGSNWGGSIRTMLGIVNTHLFAGLFGILLAILVVLLAFRALSNRFAARLEAEADGKCSLTVARKAAPPPIR